MVDAIPQFESIDVQGNTVHSNGTATTTAVSIPTALGVISEFSITCLKSQPGNLLVSLDGGTNWKTIYSGGNWSWTPKGKLTQITVKSSSGNVNYEAVFNRENVGDV
jgi:hypothetical protein